MNPFDIEKVGNPVRTAWDTLHRVPGGKKLFSQFIGRAAPYTGTIGATVLELRRGFARTELRDRKIIRNHLRSIHAIALANFAEVTSGVAMVYGLPDDARGILTGLSMEYLHKARGTLSGTCEFTPPPDAQRRDIILEPQIFDAGGTLVARAKAHWRIGPKR
jgi:acyl-coenzyme A thioesterase PaaI-like protein